MQTKQVHIKHKILGKVESNYFKIVDVEIPALKQNKFLVKNIFCSTDPYMRVNMNPNAWTIGTEPDAPILGEAVGVVIDSKNTNYPIDSIVWHKYGWREHTVLDETMTVKKFNTTDNSEENLKTILTAYSLVGRTAYYSLKNVLKIQPGQIVGVDAAAGAVGHLFVQFANLMGAKVYGITSTEEKAQIINNLGGIGLHVDPDLSLPKKLELYDQIPDKLNFYHANVGNDYFYAGLQKLEYGGIICLCGGIKHYNDTMLGPGPNISSVIYNDLTIKACNFFMQEGYWNSQWNIDMDNWLDSNREKFKCLFTEYNGIESMPDQFSDHFINFRTRVGKSICKL